MVSLSCAGAMCLIFGIFAGVTSPAGICGIAVGGAILCCCPTDYSCMGCGAKAGIVLAIIQLIGCVGAGAFFVTNVENFCDLATAIVSSVCTGSGRQLSLAESPVVDWLPAPASSGAANTALLKHAIEGSGAALLASLLPGPQIIQNLTKMVATLEHKPEDRHRRLNADTCDLYQSSGSAALQANGICEDSLSGSVSSVCPICTDVTDCGVRTTNECNGCGTTQGVVSSSCDTWKTVCSDAYARPAAAPPPRAPPCPPPVRSLPHS